ncbi:MAG: amino acid ABC transporter ATP-binding protein [Deltaproteobacteria bacterium]|nr:amino acid ABC transporter ATP-binding protein [Deltaproteobacteria bacterium]MBI2500426.1 amino acid ABC transporter ATP-binding protein [Deltaproteobacteria bacterium]
MIHVRNLYRICDEQVLLKGINLEVKEGEAVAIVGPSGSGKSTLLRCLNGLEYFQQGEVDVGPIELHSIERLKPKAKDREAIRQIRLTLGMVFQHLNLFPHMTVLQNIIEAPVSVLKISREEAILRARELLEKVNLHRKEDRYPATLSGGEQQRVAIARALAMKPKAMLFDEPTSALDPEMTGEVLVVIRDLIDEGMTTIMAAHEMSFAREMADTIIVLNQGEIIEQGSPEEVFNNPQSERTKAFLRRVVRRRRLRKKPLLVPPQNLVVVK